MADLTREVSSLSRGCSDISRKLNIFCSGISIKRNNFSPDVSMKLNNFSSLPRCDPGGRGR